MIRAFTRIGASRPPASRSAPANRSSLTCAASGNSPLHQKQRPAVAASKTPFRSAPRVTRFIVANSSDSTVPLESPAMTAMNGAPDADSPRESPAPATPCRSRIRPRSTPPERNATFAPLQQRVHHPAAVPIARLRPRGGSRTQRAQAAVGLVQYIGQNSARMSNARRDLDPCAAEDGSTRRESESCQDDPDCRHRRRAG